MAQKVMPFFCVKAARNLKYKSFFSALHYDSNHCKLDRYVLNMVKQKTCLIMKKYIYQSKNNKLFALLSMLLLCIFACTKDEIVGIDSLKPTDKVTAKIGSEGGSVELKNGNKIVIPQGALSSTQDIIINQYNASEVFGGDVSDEVVLGFEPNGLTFTKPVEIVFAAPSTLSGNIKGLGGYIDSKTGAVEVYASTVFTENGVTKLKISTNHFSKYEGRFWQTPPIDSPALEIPHYNQGESPYCWASGTQMLCEAVKHDESREICDIIGYTGIDESGIGQEELRWGSKVGEVIRSRTNINAERKIWPVGSASVMDNYLRDRLALGYPVMIHSPIEEHAFIVVGYSGSTFYLNNPASTNSNSLCYQEKRWSDFRVNELLTNQKFVTVCIPEKLNTSRLLQTINIGPKQLFFRIPGTGDELTRINYTYDSKNSSGYSFRNYALQKVEVLPSNTKELILKSIELSNSSKTTSKNFTVQTSVLNKTDNSKNYYSDRQIITVKPNSMGRYSITIPVEKFQLDKKTADIILLVESWDESKNLDKFQTSFKLDPKEESKATFVKGDVTINGYFNYTSKEDGVSKPATTGYATFGISLEKIKFTDSGGTVTGSLTDLPNTSFQISYNPQTYDLNSLTYWLKDDDPQGYRGIKTEENVTVGAIPSTYREKVETATDITCKWKISGKDVAKYLTESKQYYTTKIPGSNATYERWISKIANTNDDYLSITINFKKK